MVHSCPKQRNHGAISRGKFWGLADKPGKAACEGQMIPPGHTGREPGCWQGVTWGQGGTYDPEAVEGHVGMEALQVLQPPLVRIRVGEVCKGSEAGPDLR